MKFSLWNPFLSQPRATDQASAAREKSSEWTRRSRSPVKHIDANAVVDGRNKLLITMWSGDDTLPRDGTEPPVSGRAMNATQKYTRER
jgi:hypothetical protein